MTKHQDGSTDLDRGEALEYGRHYDNLVWIVTSLLTGANAALLAIAGDKFPPEVGVLGILLTVLTVFYAAGFRSIRRRIRQRLPKGDDWLVRGPEQWYLRQWLIYVCSFGIIAMLWTHLLSTKFPEHRFIWWSTGGVAVAIMGGLYASDHDSGKKVETTHPARQHS